MTDSPDGRITMAVLGVKIDTLEQKVDAIHADQTRLWTAHVELHQDQEQRIRYLEQRCHEEQPVLQRLREVEAEQARQKERMGIIAVGQGIYTTVAAFLASFFKS